MDENQSPLTKIQHSFREYFHLLERLKGKSAEELAQSKDYQNFLNIQGRLKGVVITGEELMEIGGDLNYITDEQIKQDDLYKELERKYERTENERRGLAEDLKRAEIQVEKYEEQKRQLEEELRKKKGGALSKLEKIRELIARKRGSLVDELQDVLEE